MPTNNLFLGLETSGFEDHRPLSKRLIPASSLHVTLSFLGPSDQKQIKKTLLQSLPPFLELGIIVHLKKLLYLPTSHPRVVAALIEDLSIDSKLNCYQSALQTWAIAHKLPIKQGDFRPHLSLARAPFNRSLWEKSFIPSLLTLTNLHLYESVAPLTYRPLWTHLVPAPFEEIEHTADLAFCIRGRSLSEVALHAGAALASKCPSFLPYLSIGSYQNLTDIIRDLNRKLAQFDQDVGAPFKAVSFHGKLNYEPILSWEMIIDV